MPTIQHHSFRRPNSVRSLIQQFHLPKTSDASSRSVAVHGPQIGIPSQERVGGPAIDHTVAGPATAGWCAFLRKGGLGAPLSDWASFGRRRSVLRVGRGPATGATRVAPVAGPLSGWAFQSSRSVLRVGRGPGMGATRVAPVDGPAAPATAATRESSRFQVPNRLTLNVPAPALATGDDECPESSVRVL